MSTEDERPRDGILQDVRQSLAKDNGLQRFASRKRFGNAFMHRLPDFDRGEGKGHDFKDSSDQRDCPAH